MAYGTGVRERDSMEGHRVRVQDRASGMTTRNGEAPDPSYWTAYDHHMADRDARAHRRAEALAALVGLARRLVGQVASSTRGPKHRLYAQRDGA